METKQIIKEALRQAMLGLSNEDIPIVVEQPTSESHGDYSTNVAMILGKKLKQNPMEVAQQIAAEIKNQKSKIKSIEKIEVVKPGFINFWLKEEELLHNLQQSSNLAMEQFNNPLSGKRIMVEFAHPNTHKEMHIGHMRTLITGEALSRIFEAAGAKVFRANYQGDIGPHVAKALFGIQVLMKERVLTMEQLQERNNSEKAHFLGEGYVRGSKDYEENKEEIDGINAALYKGSEGTEETKGPKGKESIWDLYMLTRKWSLDYYDDFYVRFYTKYDRLFFESEMVQPGKKIVEENVGKVFARENGAVIFKGEKYGLHTRVFITQAGNPTYEGKEMGNAFAEYEAFPFDLKMHIVASEQAGYFQVVFKALDLIDPAKFEGKQHHLSMGMVTLTDRKMSSRTGDILTVDWLINQVKAKVEELAKEGKISSSPSPQSPKATAPSPQSGEGNKEEADAIVEMITIGAIKYSVLKGGTGQNVAFDIEKSVALDGNSGPYLQYTFARTQSVLRKSEIRNPKPEINPNDRNPKDQSHWTFEIGNLKLEIEELALLRKLYQFKDVIVSAAENYAPNHIITYLFELAQLFNNFYQKHKVIGSKEENFRLALTEATGDTLKKGLDLLGIKAPEKM